MHNGYRIVKDICNNKKSNQQHLLSINWTITLMEKETLCFPSTFSFPSPPKVHPSPLFYYFSSLFFGNIILEPAGATTKVEFLVILMSGYLPEFC